MTTKRHSSPYVPTKADLQRIRNRPIATIYRDVMTQHEPEGQAYLVVLLEGTVYNENRECTHRRMVESWEVVFEDDLQRFEMGFEKRIKPYLRQILTDGYGNRYQSGHSTSPCWSEFWANLISSVTGRSLSLIEENKDRKQGKRERRDQRSKSSKRESKR